MDTTGAGAACDVGLSTEVASNSDNSNTIDIQILSH